MNERFSLRFEMTMGRGGTEQWQAFEGGSAVSDGERFAWRFFVRGLRMTRLWASAK